MPTAQNEVGWPEQIPEAGRSDKIMELHLQKTDIFMQLIKNGDIPLRPGVLRLVDEAIASGVRLAVCSTSNEKAVSNLVATLMGPGEFVVASLWSSGIVETARATVAFLFFCPFLKTSLLSRKLIHIAMIRAG